MKIFCVAESALGALNRRSHTLHAAGWRAWGAEPCSSVAAVPSAPPVFPERADVWPKSIRDKVGSALSLTLVFSFNGT